MTDMFFTLKQVRMNNRCPECYSNEGLELTFKQKFIENALYKAITSKTNHSLFCTNCNTEIFPVRWTDDMDQVVDYHIRATNPKPSSLKLKKLAWLFIAIDLLIITGIMLYAFGVFE